MRLKRWLSSSTSPALTALAFPQTFRMVEQAANKLLLNVADMDYKVGPRWVQRFYQRHPELKRKRHKVQEMQRTMGADCAAFHAWYEALRLKIQEYGIVVSCSPCLPPLKSAQ